MSDTRPMTIAITGSLPPKDYIPLGIVHGYAQTDDAAPLAAIAAAAVDGMIAYAETIGADAVIDVHTSISGSGLEGVRVLATGTAIRVTSDEYRRFLNPEE